MADVIDIDEKPRKSTSGHGGKRPGAGRPKGSIKTDQHDAYTVLAKAKAKRETYRAHLEELKYKQATKELVLVVDYERELSAALKIVSVTLESLPDMLERDAGLDGVAVEHCQKIIDGLREELHARMGDV